MDFTVESNNNANMFFIDGGNDKIGIGTSSPSDLLTISGDGKYIASHDGTNYAFMLGADSSGDGNFILHDSSGNVKVKLYAEAGADNYINNGGNFGINDSTPSKGRLQINQQSNTVAGIQLTNSSQSSGTFGSYPISIFFGDEQVGSSARHQASINAVREAWNNSPAALTFKTSATVNGATEKMRITSAGNVGIGTTSPSTTLQVHGGDNGTDTDVFRVSSQNGAFNVRCSDLSVANPTWTLRTFSGEPIAFAIATTEAMRINGSGNLGIGTTNPTTKLQVEAKQQNLQNYVIQAETKPKLMKL